MIEDKLAVIDEMERERLNEMVQRMVLRHGEKKNPRTHIGPPWSVPWKASPRQRVRRVWVGRWHGEY